MKPINISAKLGVKIGTVRRIVYDWKRGNIDFNMNDHENPEPENKKITMEVLEFITEIVVEAAK